MTVEKNTQAYAQLFNLPEQHCLTLSSSNRVEENSMVYETLWLEEHDASNTLIARFRTWKNHSLKPPYRKQTGWERFSVSGRLLDREVRYSKRDDMNYLH